MKIAICDANPQYQTLTAETWARALFDIEDVEFTFYRTGKELADSIRSGSFQVDLLIMDLLLPDVSGIQVLKFVREHNRSLVIVLQTEVEEMARYGYRYQVFDFIIKHSSLQEIERVINRYVRERENRKESCLKVSIQGNTRRIWLDRILYFESAGRKLRGISPDDVIEFYMKLDELEQRIRSAGFLRCHQSYLVNGSHIKAVQTGELLLEYERSIPVSRRYQKDVRRYMQHRSADEE